MSGPRVRRSHRPHARTFAKWAAEFQPGVRPVRGKAALGIAQQLSAHNISVIHASRGVGGEFGIAGLTLEMRGNTPPDVVTQALNVAAALVDVPRLALRVLSGGLRNGLSLPRHTTRFEYRDNPEDSASHCVRLLETVRRPERMKELVLFCYRLESLPSIVGSFFNLTRIYISLSQLQHLPDVFDRLVQLEVLEVNFNRLESLPASLFRCAQLQRISFQSNRLTEFAGSDVWADLRHLDLSDNLLKTLPASLFLCATLEHFDVRGNLLTEFVGGSDAWASLRYLNISNNPFKSIPRNLGRLEELCANGVRLLSIPESILEISSLVILSLSDNYLVQIPDSITRLARLRDFNVSRNHLTDLSPNLMLLRELQTLNARGNPEMRAPLDRWRQWAAAMRVQIEA